jgi:hypothetical protein
VANPSRKKHMLSLSHSQPMDSLFAAQWSIHGSSTCLFFSQDKPSDTRPGGGVFTNHVITVAVPSTADKAVCSQMYFGLSKDYAARNKFCRSIPTQELFWRGELSASRPRKKQYQGSLFHVCGARTLSDPSSLYDVKPTRETIQTRAKAP